MSEVQVAVYGPTDALIAWVPRHQSATWLDELNGTGSGSFDLHLDDDLLVTYPGLLDDGNSVRFFVAGAPVKLWLVETVLPSEVAPEADRLVTVSGRGYGAVCSYGVVYPEYQLRPFTADERPFDYSSVDGSWRSDETWTVPAGVTQAADSTARANNPKSWPDPSAQWLWVSDPEVSAAEGYNWFRSDTGDFVVPGLGANVKVYASFDNDGVVRIDGEEVLTSDPATAYNWQTTFSYTMFLAPGAHTLAAQVFNRANTAVNPGGFLASVWTLDGAGNRDVCLFRTTPATTIVKGYGDPPGWHGCEIVDQVLAEAATRGVFLAGMLGRSTWSGVTDSAGQTWTDRQDRSFRIGTTDGLDVLAQCSEVAFDWYVTADSPIELELFKRKGTDLRSSVRLLPVKDLSGSTVSTNYAALRNRALVRWKRAWLTVNEPVSEGARGRRETGLQVGDAESEESAEAIADALFEDSAEPEVTISVRFTSAAGPQPYVDFVLGDTVTTLRALAGLVAGRVMAISGADAEGRIDWTVDLYPEPAL